MIIFYSLVILLYNEKTKKKEVDYYLTEEILEQYSKKPLELRLQRLYMGNLMRKSYSKKLIELHDKFRKSSI